MRVSGQMCFAWRTVRRNRLRSALMMIAITIGIAGLTILSSIGQATKEETLARFKNMVGTFDTLIVRPGAGSTRGMTNLGESDTTLTFDDAAAVAGAPFARNVVQIENALKLDASYGDRHDSPAVFGVSADWGVVRGESLAEGSFLTAPDEQALARVAVLGADARRELFGDNDPLGKIIRIAGVPFLVKGVLNPRGAGPTGASLDDLIFIPVTTAAKRLFNRDYLTMVIVQLKNPERSSAAMTELRRLLRARHRLDASVPDDFTITSPRVVMAQVAAMGSAMGTLLRVISALALAVGGIVIFAVMLAGVGARRSEIGLRRAAGASRKAVAVQFLAEAGLISLLGGLIGMAIGVGGTQAVSGLEHLPFLVDIPMLIAAAALSLVLGVVFGAVPALKAAKVDPIEALRG
jgi:putative ABC transport system permease protein